MARKNKDAPEVAIADEYLEMRDLGFKLREYKGRARMERAITMAMVKVLIKVGLRLYEKVCKKELKGGQDEL